MILLMQTEMLLAPLQCSEDNPESPSVTIFSVSVNAKKEAFVLVWCTLPARCFCLSVMYVGCLTSEKSPSNHFNSLERSWHVEQMTKFVEQMTKSEVLGSQNQLCMYNCLCVSCVILQLKVS